MKHCNPLEFKDHDPADPVAAVTAELAALKAALETKANDSAAQVKARMDALEAKMSRIGAGALSEEQNEIVKKAFNSFLRGGEAKMVDLEKKAMTVAGEGAIAPQEFGAEIIKVARQFSPIRQYARVVTIGGPSIVYPKRTGSTAATWLAETADRTSSEIDYAPATLTPYEMATFTPVSNQLLEDNAYNLEGELSADLGESFGIAEGAAFVSGDGSGKPKGLLASGTGIPEMVTGAAANFPTSNPADVLIKMFHAVPTPYAGNGVWLMNRATLGVIRQFKDGQGRYLVLDGLTKGAPTTLLGHDVVEAPDMPDIGAGNYPIIFGDLFAGYRIVDRVDLQMLRDPYSLATKGQTVFHARKRVGGDVIRPTAMIKLKVAVS